MHALLAILNIPSVSDAYGDVLSVYPFWLEQGLGTDGRPSEWLGIDVEWVYPLLAWAPILVSGVLGPEALPLVWMLMVTALDAVAFALLLRVRRGHVLGWTWLALQLALGPVALARIDTVTVAVCIIGLIALRSQRPGVAAAAFTAAAWMKVWPGVLYLALLIARRERLRIVIAGALVSGAVLAIAALLGSQHALSFLLQQEDRGLQIEAVAATPFMWQAMLGEGHVYFDRQIYTFQVDAPGVGRTADLATPVLIAAVVALCALGALAVRRSHRREAIVWLAVALVASMIVTNKVGSPQFVLWLTVPALLLAELGARRHWIGVGAIGLVAALTHLQFPWTYDSLVSADPFGVLLLTLRNLVHVGILVGAVWMLLRAARRGPYALSVDERREQVAHASGLDQEGVVAEAALEHDRLGTGDARGDAGGEPLLIGDGEEPVAGDADDERR
ncbi:Protein of unknown function [Agrococcus baldri]|uniref:DUF2029 domain-containing protein n=1 Tax=Agrococcus baldri TaxID=153730 RepID=A0AA94HNJ5_9MICO|nr:Protein of unknown function [Agrococcus baldri]